VLRRIALAVALVACAIAVYVAAGGTQSSQPSDRALALSGGEDATIADATGNAFSLAVPKLSSKQRRAFAVGNSFFNRNWVSAPASTTGRDGLGPTFNAQSCSSCHFKDGRAQPPSGSSVPELGLLLRLSVADDDGPQRFVARYGGQLQDGVPAEGRIRITHTPRRGHYADGTRYTLRAPHYEIVDRALGALPKGVRIGPRIAPAIFGVGLLEAVPEKTITEHADPRDADGDGISGRPNRVIDARTGALVLGRFGWKANVPTVEQQNAGAFNGDIGITTPIFPKENCPDGQRACEAAPRGGQPEVDAKKLGRVTFYARTLAVPARRGVGAQHTSAGERTFADLGCSACHRLELKTGDSDVAALSKQAIRPYTDMLLHDMGPGLADGRPDSLASGSEWRTAPLWGIGLVKAVNRHSRFLHDGRARSIEEAILWHGGEGAAAMQRFRKLSRREREELLAFLRSL
jgi:CxxC motif-containing protein (DUF1111 family)